MATKEGLINRKIGKVIARKRKAAGFTQEQVAEELGIGTEAFSRIERGLNSAGIFKLYQLANLFECGVESFFVEGSRRPIDQTEHMLQLMKPLSPADRQLLIEIVEKLARRIAKEANKKTKDDTDGFLL